MTISNSDMHCILCEAGVSTFDAHGTIYHRAKRHITDEYLTCPQTSPKIAALKDGERILREDIAAQANIIQELRAQLALATRTERERCAKIARDAKEPGVLGPRTAFWNKACEHIARAIEANHGE